MNLIFTENFYNKPQRGKAPNSYLKVLKARPHCPMDYKDIIDLPYPRDDWNFLMKHPRMSIESRAKIFSPFAALRGHNAKIAETAERHLEENRDEKMLEKMDF
jgi:hypothetical protein